MLVLLFGDNDDGVGVVGGCCGCVVCHVANIAFGSGIAVDGVDADMYVDVDDVGVVGVCVCGFVVVVGWCGVAVVFVGGGGVGDVVIGVVGVVVVVDVDVDVGAYGVDVFCMRYWWFRWCRCRWCCWWRYW